MIEYTMTKEQGKKRQRTKNRLPYYLVLCWNTTYNGLDEVENMNLFEINKTEISRDLSALKKLDYLSEKSSLEDGRIKPIYGRKEVVIKDVQEILKLTQEDTEFLSELLDPIDPNVEDIQFLADVPENISSNKQIPIITIILLLICHSDVLFNNITSATETIQENTGSKIEEMDDKELKKFIKKQITFLRYFQFKQIFERAINPIEADKLVNYYKNQLNEQLLNIDPRIEILLNKLNAGYLYYEFFHRLGWELFQPVT